MKKQKPVFYFCQMYRVNYWFFLGWKIADYEKHITKEFGPGFADIPTAATGHTEMYTRAGQHRHILVWTKFKNKLMHPTLAHECLHAANWTLERAGWTPDLMNDEPQTYLMTNLIRQALQLDI